ncbi:MAG: Type II secretion system protein E [Candidatus Nomurabacteria bacterium GW2011_GWF2_40_12]|uniref:Type II secretion system protein E n=1 Tax=Candidatus Nomurabacteria bacterium GW2011_GWF2_40_12 TaxID=1618776 RepID=A0A0G0T893_9BACT|nr:MAG: Type II secretion system protein E [Candidatus Nomurabacteria bacterium GW2011_GWF2_40_12]
MQINEEQLKKFILDSGLVKPSQFEEAEEKAKKTKQKLGDILLSGGKISETDLKRMEAFVLGIPFISLTNQKIDFSVLSLIPEPIARNYNIVAYKKNEDTLEVAMLDVDDLPVIDIIKKRSGLKILPRLHQICARAVQAEPGSRVSRHHSERIYVTQCLSLGRW